MIFVRLFRRDGEPVPYWYKPFTLRKIYALFHAFRCENTAVFPRCSNSKTMLHATLLQSRGGVTAPPRVEPYEEALRRLRYHFIIDISLILVRLFRRDGEPVPYLYHGRALAKKRCCIHLLRHASSLFTITYYLLFMPVPYWYKPFTLRKIYALFRALHASLPQHYAEMLIHFLLLLYRLYQYIPSMPP